MKYAYLASTLTLFLNYGSDGWTMNSFFKALPHTLIHFPLSLATW